VEKFPQPENLYIACILPTGKAGIILQLQQKSTHLL